MSECTLYADLNDKQRTLVDSYDARVRRHAADSGLGLDKLMGDPDPNVRCSVAAQRYGLHKLIYDEHPVVREAVAWEEFGLGILKSDKDVNVRCAVAHVSDRFWVQLKSDPAWEVRQAVAWEGGFSDELESDPDPRVRDAAKEAIGDVSRVKTAPPLATIAEQARENTAYKNNRMTIVAGLER